MSALARAAGIAKSTLSYWESGTRLPSMTELESVMTALNLNSSQRSLAVRLINAPRAVKHLRKATHQVVTVNGDLLRAIRLRKGWTQTQVAEQLGVRQSTIAKWERGEVWPSQSNLHTLCYCLDATLEELELLVCGKVDLQSESDRSMTLEEATHRFGQMIFNPQKALQDLQFFTLEADLWALSGTKAWAKRLLAEVYARHSQYLAEFERFTEVRECAVIGNRLAKEANVPTEAILPGSIAELRASVELGLRGASSAIQELDEIARQVRLPAYAAWITSEQARYFARRGDESSSLEVAEFACDQARKCENPSEVVYRKLDLAKLLLLFNKPLRAQEMLPQYDHPSQAPKFTDAYLHFQTALSLGQRSLAGAWLGQMEHLSNTSPDPRQMRLTAAAALQL